MSFQDQEEPRWHGAPWLLRGKCQCGGEADYGIAGAICVACAIEGPQEPFNRLGPFIDYLKADLAREKAEE